MEHTATNHGAEGRVVEPSFWIVCSFIDCSFSRGWVVQWWGGGRGRGGRGLWGDVQVIFCVVFECFVIAVGRVIGWLAPSCGATRLPGWKGTPIIGLIWERCGRAKDALNQLTPIFFVGGFVNPASQGAMSVNLNGEDVLKKEAEVFNHEVSPIVCRRPT